MLVARSVDVGVGGSPCMLSFVAGQLDHFLFEVILVCQFQKSEFEGLELPLWHGLSSIFGGKRDEESLEHAQKPLEILHDPRWEVFLVVPYMATGLQPK